MASRILVADDSVTIQKVVELTFSKEDFVLVQARSGEETIRKARESRPDLILLDLVMPDKTGYEVCTALRAEPMLRGVPIIMLAGTFEAFDKEKGQRVGANDFVTKPFESQTLIGKVKQLLFARTVDMGPPPAPAKATPSPVAPVAGQARTGPAAAAARGGPAAAVTPPPAPLSAVLGSASPEPASAPPPPAPRQARDLPTLDLQTLELESISGAPWAAAPGPSLLPEGLSLEELLGPPPGSAPELATQEPPEPTPLEDFLPESQPVFDLTADMQGPSLPLVEVGTGEPPEVSVEDLLGGIETPPAAPDLAPGAEETAPEIPPLEGLVQESQPVFDLTADMQGPSLPLVEVGTGEPPEVSVEDLLRPAWASHAEAEFEEVPGSGFERPSEGGPGVVPPAEVPPEFEPLLDLFTGQPEGGGPPASSADIGELVDAAAAAAPSVERAPLLEEALEAQAAPEAIQGLTGALQEAGAPGTAVPPPVAAAVGAEAQTADQAPEMRLLRQAATERVAHELAKELSDKLIERVERIVWEVVPDLAEVLINREIERIRAMAEDKQTS